jgi:hypothetical protein
VGVGQSQLRYVEGDLFKSLDGVDDKTLIIIPHVVNDEKVWGAGFVIPLAQHFPLARELYMMNPLKLGHTQFVTAGQDHATGAVVNVIIANMVAQSFGQNPPLQYDALESCLKAVAIDASEHNPESWEKVEIRCPLFGAGIAGGDWNKIEKLLRKHWKKLSVTVYYLPQFLPPNFKPPQEKT